MCTRIMGKRADNPEASDPAITKVCKALKVLSRFQISLFDTWPLSSKALYQMLARWSRS